MVLAICIVLCTMAMTGSLQTDRNYCYLSPEYSLIEIDGKFGLVDSLRNIVIPAMYEALHYLPSTKHKRLIVTNDYLGAKKKVDASSLFPYKKEGKWGYMNRDGEEIIEPKYTAASFFSSGLASVCYKGKFGYIDSLENWIITPSLKTTFDFHGALAPSFKDGKYGFIGKNGQMAMAHRYDSIHFKHWVYVASEGSKKSYISTDGTLLGILDSSISSYIYGGAWVIDSGESYTLIRKKQLNKPIRMEGKWAHWKHEDKILSINNKSAGVLNMRTGTWMLRPYYDNISHAMNDLVEIDEMEWGVEPSYYRRPLPAIYYMWHYLSDQEMRLHRSNSLWYIAKKNGKHTLYKPDASDSFAIPSHLVKKVSKTTWLKIYDGLIQGSTGRGTVTYHPATRKYNELP